MATSRLAEIIDNNLIWSVIENSRQQSGERSRVSEILAKARHHASSGNNPLTSEEMGVLINIDSSDHQTLEELFDTANTIKKIIFGLRVSLFAPLHVSNWCRGSCLYCGFRSANREFKRNILTDEELVGEVVALQRQGHKHLQMIMGDHPEYPFEDFIEALKIASAVKTEPRGKISRIDVSIPPLSVQQFRDLHSTKLVGTYTSYQETYHHQTYRQVHPYGPKADYYRRLSTMDRAREGGMEDVGIGALLGLYDYRFEALSLFYHAHHLEEHYGAAPRTISVPRLQPAMNTLQSRYPPYRVSDIDFKKLVAVLRCVMPYSDIVLSAREAPAMRCQLYDLGISQLSAGSRIEPGAYQKNTTFPSAGQFELSDHRSLGEIVKELLSRGLIPSWCSQCWCQGCQGQDFMKKAADHQLKAVCQQQALATCAEYLEDYGDDEAWQLGKALLGRLSH
ncbi:MAG: [FeFe] hydrogenase H-cluster radical SAM maturase HydG [Chlamydiota bacterium]